MDAVFAAWPEEKRLVARARTEPAAFAALYDHYFPRVYNYVRYRLHAADATDEVTSRIFELVWSRLSSYDPTRGPFPAWLYAIARNEVNAYLRRKTRQRWLSLDHLFQRASEEVTPEQAALDAEGQNELLCALAKLGVREREILAGKFGAGLTNRQIARLAGISESNVAVILHRAVRRLRAELKAKG